MLLAASVAGALGVAYILARTRMKMIMLWRVGMCKLTCYMAMMLSLPLFDDNLCKFRVQNLSKFSLEKPYMHRLCITRRANDGV
jgi:hypothetical protein